MTNSREEKIQYIYNQALDADEFFKEGFKAGLEIMHDAMLNENIKDMQFTRVEVINRFGIVYAGRNNYTLSIQDEGETLKIFEKGMK